MDKSKLPPMSKKSSILSTLLGYGKKKKKTKPGAMDDDAKKRIKDRRNRLKDATKP